MLENGGDLPRIRRRLAQEYAEAGMPIAAEAIRTGVWDEAEQVAPALRALIAAERDSIERFQGAVGKWMVEVFGDEIAMDPLERIMRFLEEAMELAQALGMTEAECGRVAGYVWGRPVGEPTQEVGGVMVTLAALCFRQDIGLADAALTEFRRIDSPEMRKRIFEKQAFKRLQGITSDGGFRAAVSE
jgi:hypothetical protein